MSKPPPLESLSFEDALKELETIVRGMESGQMPLEQAMAAYARGNALKDYCAQKLDAAKLQVEQLTRDAAGNITATEFSNAS